MSYTPPSTDTSTGILSHLSHAYLERLCALEILEQGFDASDASALSELVAQAVQFLACLCFEAKSAAQHGRRAQVGVLDVLGVAQVAGMSASDLKLLHQRQSATPADVNTAFEPTGFLDLPVEPALVLPQDQDQVNEELFSRLPIQPDHLPFLPPPHAYKRTPVYDEKDNSTEVRVRETRLVESSLRNLIRATTSASASARPHPSSTSASHPLPSNETQPPPEEEEEDLVSLELQARSNTDDVMDASVVNWKAGRAIQSLGKQWRDDALSDKSGGGGHGLSARTKKIRWSLA